MLLFKALTCMEISKIAKRIIIDQPEKVSAVFSCISIICAFMLNNIYKSLDLNFPDVTNFIYLYT